MKKDNLMMTKDAYIQTLQPLMELEHETLPILVLEQIVPLELLFDKFPALMMEYLGDAGKAVYTKDDFTFEKYSFQDDDGIPYYVFVGRFPFQQDRLHLALMKSFYIVVSEALQGIHCFGEILCARIDGDVRRFYYDVRYFAREEDALVTYSAKEADSFIEKDLAQEVIFWAYLIEQEGIVGEKGMLQSEKGKAGGE